MRPGRLACFALVTALLGLAPRRAVADEPVQPWQRLGASLEGIYGFPNVLFHVGAAVVTPPLALWVDEPVQESFQRHDPFGNAIGPISFYAGGIAPLAVPATLYLGGLAADDGELATAGAATIQAVVVQAVVVTGLKWLTDRKGPYPDGDPSRRRSTSGFFRDSKSATDFDFNPFDLQGGLRWPSGHTASNVAMVSALVAFYPDEAWIAFVGYPLALVVGIGMIEGDYHWLSDVVAGALIGHVIGWQVGREFRHAYEARNTRTRAEDRLPLPGSAPHVAPTAAPLGLQLWGTF